MVAAPPQAARRDIEGAHGSDQAFPRWSTGSVGLATPSTAPTIVPAPLDMPIKNIAAPITAEMTKYCRFDQDRPACAIRTESGMLLLFL